MHANVHAMAWQKFNKEFDNETENFLWLEKSPPRPHNFSNGPSLIQY